MLGSTCPTTPSRSWSESSAERRVASLRSTLPSRRQKGLSAAGLDPSNVRTLRVRWVGDRLRTGRGRRPKGSAMASHTSSWPSQKHLAYAGIGSRETPPGVLDLMGRVASQLSIQGWVLRTGMAGGADQAFYRGAHAGGALELYLPWPSFEADARSPAGAAQQYVLGQPSPAAYEMAARFHPAWSRPACRGDRLGASDRPSPRHRGLQPRPSRARRAAVKALPGRRELTQAIERYAGVALTKHGA